MSDYVTHTARLIPYSKRPKAASGFVTAYLFEPAPGDGQNLGNLYIAIEVLSGGREAEEVVDLTIDTLGNRYYNRDYDGEVMDRFETAIKATNRELADYINRGHAAWVGKMSAVAAILYDNELHIAQTGSAEAYLYRNSKGSRITAPPANRIQQPSKIFGSIASGSLEVGDAILLTTPALIHQLTLDTIRETIIENPPNVAIAKFTETLSAGEGISRVAALVIQLTTPELAAQAVRVDAPSDIAIGGGGTLLENAKASAAPLANVALNHGRKLGAAARSGGSRYLPVVRTAALKLVNWLRDTLAKKRGRYVLGSVAGAIIVVILIVIMAGSHNDNLTKLVQQFESLAKQEATANALIASGNRDDAATIITTIQPQAKALQAGNNHKAVDARLAKTALPADETTTIDALVTAISNTQDAVDNITTPSTTTLSDLTNLRKAAKPTRIELVGSRAIVFDADSTIYRVDLASGISAISTANTSQLGTIVATTPASTGDGVYILTSAPAVWLYRPSTDTLTAESISPDTWPSGTSIASYGGNLYILGQDTIYKSLPTIAGFAPKTSYLVASNAVGLDKATALAVDGSIYVANPGGLHRYLSGALTASAPLPHGLGPATALASVADSTLLTYTDTQDGRFAVFTLGMTAITFLRQYQLSGTPLVAASYDSSSKTVYAVSGTKVVKFATNF